jgi:hypothetical protein
VTLLGPALLLIQVLALPGDEPLDTFDIPTLGDVKLSEKPVAWAVTDAGQPFPLFSASMAGRTLPDIAAEDRFLDSRKLLTSVIRTADPDLKSNCHGWVFTGGMHWVRGGTVDQVLKENGYQMVSQPEPGDVALYRDRDGVPTHSAVVRSIGDDGTLVLESKWGHMGRFLHPATTHPYANDACTYYHSDRKGHRLHDK